MAVKQSVLAAALWLLAAPALASGPADVALTAFLKTCPEVPVDAPYRIRHFGNTAAMAERLLELIRSGEKTATFATPWLYAGDASATPRVDGYSVVTDFSGKPALVLRTLSVETLPFNQITAAHTQYEGPGARPLDAWRQIHEDFWTPGLEAKGRAFSTEMPVTVERFQVVCAPD